jgi:hypothetical protein
MSYDTGASQPYYLNGGTLDATGAGANVYTSDIAGGSGRLKISDTQSLVIDNGYSIGFDVQGGGDLEIIDGVSNLNGSTYETGNTSVEGAFLIVGENSTLGKDADSVLSLSASSDSTATNFGTIIENSPFSSRLIPTLSGSLAIFVTAR